MHTSPYCAANLRLLVYGATPCQRLVLVIPRLSMVHRYSPLVSYYYEGLVTWYLGDHDLALDHLIPNT